MNRFCQLRLARALLLAACCQQGAVSAEALQLQAGVANPERAKINYMLNCQGCHGQAGTESLDGAVPALKDYVGNFLRVPGGREFLVQVPGSANAAISDAALAELLNWMLQTQSAAQLPTTFQPFSATEVKGLRQFPLTDVVGTRAALVRAIEQAK